MQLWYRNFLVSYELWPKETPSRPHPLEELKRGIACWAIPNADGNVDIKQVATFLFPPLQKHGRGTQSAEQQAALDGLDPGGGA